MGLSDYYEDREYQFEAKISELERQLKEARAEIEQLKRSEYAYKDIKEYEDIIGGKTSDSFRIGWAMARTTMKMLDVLTGERELK